MKACPYCAEEIRDDAVKCRYCGEWLPEVGPAEVGEADQGGITFGDEVVHESSMCPACGALAVPDDAFCTSCGATLEVSTSIEEVQTGGAETPDAGATSPERAARPQVGSSWYRRRGVIAAALLAAVVVIVVVALSAAHHAPAPTEGFTGPTFAPTEPDASLEVQRVLDASNAQPGGYKGLIHIFVPEYGPSRCWAEFSADFPDQLLVTLIKPSGFWVQLFVDPTGGVEATSTRSGADHTAAGIDPATFDATGYRCQVVSDSTITLIP